MSSITSYPAEFDCPLTYRLMLEPSAVLPCEHTYEKIAIKTWQQFEADSKNGASFCPLCKRSIDRIVPNEKLRKKIQMYIDAHPEVIKGRSLSKETQEWSVFPKTYDPACLASDLDLVYSLNEPALLVIETYMQTGENNILAALDESHQKKLYFLMHCLHRSQNKDVSDPNYGQKAFFCVEEFSSTNEERNAVAHYLLIEVLLKETLIKALQQNDDIGIKNCLLYLEQYSKGYAEQLHYLLYHISRSTNSELPTHLYDFGRLAFRGEISVPADLKIRAINELLIRLYRSWGL